MASKDPSTQSNPEVVRVTHSCYEIDVDFDRKVLEGYVQLDVKVEQDAPTVLVLDTNTLTIHSAWLLTAPASEALTQPLDFHLGTPHAVLGTPLIVELPGGLLTGQSLRVGVRFTTSPSSSAVQFLEAQQTAGGKLPYLFTQCQAIHARALVPCQDSPGAKMTYSAVVRVPLALTALMSALSDDDAVAGGLPYLDSVPPALPVATPPVQTRVFAFRQPVPMPPYLVALAVGELESRELGPRSRIWSEPCMVEVGRYEFEDTAKFLDAGEAIAGPYVWGRMDLLLLPPSFPYGGMENPTLTFLTPTLIAGDRSMTRVVAHEIAHSWFGNLVTNSTWEHFWLNEGWTMFLERKIMGRLNGEAYLQFQAADGFVQLTDTISRLGAENPYTCLVPDLSGGVDPDDVFSRVPYEKGFHFLYWLQTLTGGPAVFEPFVRAYLDNFKFQSVSSSQFKEFFLTYFKDLPAVHTVDWATWFHAPGMPKEKNTYDTSMADAAYALALRWHTADVMGRGNATNGPEGASASDLAGWGADLLVAFLDKLHEYRSMTPLHVTVVNHLAHLYDLYPSKNCEIRASLYRLAVAAEDPEVLPHAVDLLKTQGRMKFIRPLYRALFCSKMGKELALSTFQEQRATYHPIAQKVVAQDLQLDNDSA